MILGQRSQIYDAKRFAERMARALLGIVRVTVGEVSPSLCTGWLLTPRIVVVPAYVLNNSEQSPRTIKVEFSTSASKVEFSTPDDSRDDHVVADPEILDTSLGPGMALLQLRRAHRGKLDLALSPPEIGDQVFLLHFPGGTATLSLSIGQLSSMSETLVSYTAESQPGSGGGPLFDQNWQLIGIHVASDQQNRRNEGINRTALLEMFQRSHAWKEIAHFHRLADVAASSKRLLEQVTTDQTRTPELVKAALTWRFSPRALSAQARDNLRNKVVDPTDKQWTLQTSVRRNAIRSVGSLADLQLRLPRRRPKDDAQLVIDRIILGPPYDLSTVKDEVLPWWIQASRWFAGVVPSLPTPSEVTRELERRRVRSSLDSLAGSGFSGREKELKTMRKWFSREPPVPLVISGIGGVGKSALVAKFASELPPSTVILWLDFDRADLAPDDAVSIIAGIGERASTQIEDFEVPAADASNWESAAQKLGRNLLARLPSGPSGLLVLDSFEVAQHAEKYQELWKVLDRTAAEIPALRVIVSGRAPVENLTLGGQNAESLTLGGLRPAEVRAWLRERGVNQPRILTRLVTIARGIPLIIQMAFHLLHSGEKLDNLPKKLPREIVLGYLYRRILRRVQNPEFEEVARAALVLRRLSAEMVDPILGGLIKLPSGEVPKWFSELRRETALVTGTDVLRLRPEVRSAALRLLEQDNRELVRAIELRAQHWYEQQDTNDPEIAAELVYHRLRLGNVKGAEGAWRQGCAIHLQNAAEDLKPKARAWLNARLGQGSADAARTRPGELATADTIRDLRSRGLDRGVSALLGSLGKMSSDSPLLFHEAFEMRAAGQRETALKVLEEASSPNQPESLDRAVLHALLLAELGNRRAASSILALIEQSDLWSARSGGQIESLAVTASRVRLSTDLDSEMRALRSPTFNSASLLAPIDVIFPKLQAKLSALRPDFTVELEIPREKAELPTFAAKIQELRKMPPISDSDASVISEADRVLAGQLSELAIERWSRVTETTFLEDVSRMIHDPSVSSDSLFPGIFGSFALFLGNMGGAYLMSKDVLGVGMMPWIQTILVTEWDERSKQFLQEGTETTSPASLRESLRAAQRSKARLRNFAVACFILSPDPLEILTNLIAGTTTAA